MQFVFARFTYSPLLLSVCVSVLVLACWQSRQSRAQMRAQTIIPAKTAPAPVFSPSPKPSPAVDATIKPTGAKPAVTENHRLRALLKLKFDRRPETILKAWAGMSDDADKTKPRTATEKGKPVTDSEKKTLEQNAIIKETRAFQRDVNEGKWDKVKTYLGKLPKGDRAKVYDHMLTSLATPHRSSTTPSDPFSGQSTSSRTISTSNTISPNDIIGLADASPETLSEEQVKKLARLVRVCVANGNVLDELVDLMVKGSIQLGGTSQDARGRAARLLIESGNSKWAESFLPPLDSDLVKNDPKWLTLLADYYKALYRREQKPSDLEKAWQANQKVLSLLKIDTQTKTKALATAVELSNKVRKELGYVWLRNSLTKRPKEAKQILANLGAAAVANRSAHRRDATYRLQTLKLQKTAVEMLLETAPKLAADWQDTLNILGQNWLAEAETTNRYSQDGSRGPRMRYDRFGNFYYVDENDPFARQTQSSSSRPIPIKTGDLLEVQPNDAWLAHIDRSMQPRFSMVTAELLLKVNDEDLAFPYIEQLAPKHPDEARQLVHRFLQIWTHNHDPNADRRRRNPYIFVYGFDRKADAIPLTRSKQERNLEELKKWVARIRQLPIKPVDEKLLAKAFTTCHSSAEVYRLKAFESVFGALESLKPGTIAEVAQTMRSNLVSVWREVRRQEAMKTRRKEPEIQQEVLRGYRVARQIVAAAKKAHPNDWQLQLARACLMHDENEYQQSVHKSSDFSKRRDEAFQQFALAAKAYAKNVGSLKKEEQSIDVYGRWFYAALGAVDLGKITHESHSDERQFELIKKAINDLPGETAEFHMAKFANNLFARMSPIKPEVKFRYLKGGFAIVGDHPRAWEAKKVYDYYKDLVTEIRLVTRVDGSDRVGHQQPFGVFVQLLHTTELERESGGFAKYVQNQNNMAYAYNYGRPAENYREKFEAIVNEALGEYFDVLAVTFEDTKTMKSRPAERDGWRTTPYAYLLLKARGPQVDMIPPVRLDLDFLDTSGYAVLPVESPSLPIDAGVEPGEPRPMRDLKITQTLDERQAAEGRLVLEVKASAVGLVPPLESILELDNAAFLVVSTDDQGVLPTKFDTEGNVIQIVSDRSWTIEYAAKQDLNAPPQAFTFCSAKLDTNEMKFQRYNDVDLVDVEKTVPLVKQYGEAYGATRLWLVVPALLGLGLIGLMLVRFRGRKPETRLKYALPEDINPFTVISLLERLRHESRLSTADREDIDQSIQQIELHYFSNSNGEGSGNDSPERNGFDLDKIANRWIDRTARYKLQE